MRRTHTHRTARARRDKPLIPTCVRRPARRRAPTVGAPRGNLNALRHGAYAHPLDRDRVAALAAAIVDAPDDLAAHLTPVIRSIQARAPDPFRALTALGALLPPLTSAVAAILFRRELDQALRPLPPGMRDDYRQRIMRLAATKRPEDRLSFLRKMVRTRKQKQFPF